MASLNQVVALFADLQKEWAKPAKNLKQCGDILDNLKISLTKMIYLPTGDATASQKELMLARDVLEIGVEYSIAVRDIPAYERYMSQLKCYYYDYKDLIGESPNKYKILGLNLLFLLSQNHVAEFHTELELLPAEIINSNPFIRHSLALEQYFMEGSYNKIFQAMGQVPIETYNFFMDLLLATVRAEIAACLEKSYERISLGEAAKRLNLRTQDEVKAFGANRNWTFSADGFYHYASEVPKQKEPIPSVELAEQAIFYAKELEMIV